MKEITRRRLLFFYILILLAASIFSAAYAVLDIDYHAAWAEPWAMRCSWLYSFIVMPMTCAATGAVPALYFETGHLHRLTRPIRLLLMLLCTGTAVCFLLYPILWLSGAAKGELALWFWAKVYSIAVHPVYCILLGFAGGFGLKVWLDRKEDAGC